MLKSLHSTYGHLAGDEILRSVALALKQTFARPKDLAVRMGGEEFVVVLPHTTAAELVVLATRAVLAVEALNLPHSASPVAGHVTISVGGATRTPDPAEFPFSLVEAADKAMYEGQEDGPQPCRLDDGPDRNPVTGFRPTWPCFFHGVRDPFAVAVCRRRCSASGPSTLTPGNQSTNHLLSETG